MNKHREKCNHLKEIRKNMAEELGVELNQTVCTFEGDCKGTCPKCEQEERKLSKALLKGTAVAASAAMMLTGCAKEPVEMEGDVAYVLPYENEIDGGLEENDIGEGDIIIEENIEPITNPLDGDVGYVGEVE